jgi:cytoskeletal protein RodZ
MLRIQYAPDERSGSNDASKRLAERFGIPEEEVKKLLTPKSNEPAPLPKIEPIIMNQNRDTRSGWNAISTLGALLGIVGILSLIVVIMMMMNHHHERMMVEHIPPPPSAVLPTPAPAPPAAATMPDSCCTPSSAQTTEESKTEEPKPQTPAKPKRKVSRQSSAYKTSNSMEAEERLAELRAEGNSKAKITTTKKNGVLMFEVK